MTARIHPVPRKFLMFGLQFVPLFILSVAAYLAVFSYYQPLVVGAANAVTQRLSPATHIEIDRSGLWESHVFTPKDGMRPLKRWNLGTPHLILLSLALLPALLLATPAPLGKRFGLLALALIVTPAIHVLSVIGLMRGVWCLNESPGAFHCLWLLRLVYSSGQLFAAALWVLLTWRYWLERP